MMTDINAYTKTFLWAMTPFLELRASIPLGYSYGLSLIEAFLVSIIALVCITIVLVFILPFCVRFLESYIPMLDGLLKRKFSKLYTKHSHRMNIFGDIILVLFVAIPLPGSGAWTGVLVAYLFGISRWKSIFLISIGIILSGIIVASLTHFGTNIWEYIVSY